MDTRARECRKPGAWIITDPGCFSKLARGEIGITEVAMSDLLTYRVKKGTQGIITR